LNNSLLSRYGQWVSSAFHGEFGRSLAYEAPVLPLLRPRITKTLQIVVPALFLGWCIGAALSIAAVSRGGRAISWVELPSVVLSLIPEVIGVSLLMWLAVGLHLPSITTAWLPIASLTLSLVPMVILHSTNAMSEASTLPFVFLAARRGIRGTRWFRLYLLPAAANPLISLAGLSFAGTIAASLLVEVLLGWPGLGPIFLEAAQARDYPVVATVVMLLGSVLTISSLAADLALYRLDPRIRLGNEDRH
jgi:peptide/nickel transport system permease protein